VWHVLEGYVKLRVRQRLRYALGINRRHIKLNARYEEINILRTLGTDNFLQLHNIWVFQGLENFDFS
jgi:hypothetical protein